jgi:hypothetical protein
MTTLSCRCGQTRITLTGPPILAVDCCCTSCRSAGARLQSLPGAPKILGPHGETHFILYRKDRVTLPDTRPFRAHRLTQGSKTRRVLAPCCATPLFVEFQGGHWLSLYAGLWPEGTAPRAEMRTMTADLPDPSLLPRDIPNARSHSPLFIWRLLTAWAAMGFRAPKLVIEGKVDA